MRVFILLLALVATPFVAGISQDRPGKGVHCERRSVRATEHLTNVGRNDCLTPTPPVVISGATIKGKVYDNTGPYPYPALPGLTVTVSGVDQLTGSPVNETAVTDRLGEYMVTGLPGGTYTVCPPQASAGLTQSLPQPSPWNPTCATGVGLSFPVAVGEIASWNDFGFKQQ
jgi:hypothetical protein